MKVAIGISGGVDSAVSALLLKQQGYDVLGITMKLFEDESVDKMLEDAKKVCEEVGIKHLILDLSKEFKEIVINNFVESYKHGLTPNPCVLCNKHFKFGLLYEKAKELGYDHIATGHYVKIIDNKLYVCDNNKDQSYFLYSINKDILDKIIFPLKDFENKDEIRKIAKENNLSIFEKKDSQEICFIKDDDYVKFIENYLEAKEGNIIDLEGNILGKHNDLFKSNLIANNVNLLVDELPNECFAKIRSRGVLAPCKVNYIDNKLYVTFNEKQRAITKGQSVVLYKDNICLGGGVIDEVY